MGTAAVKGMNAVIKLVFAACGVAAVMVALARTDSYAQQSDVPRVDLSVPGEEHKILNALEGVWDVTLKIPIGPDKFMEGRSQCEAMWVMDGRFLRQEYKSVFQDKPLTVVRYLGFNRHKGRFVEVHFESTHTDVMYSEGSVSPDGKTITCWGNHVDMMANQEVKVRTATAIQDKDTFILEMIYTDAEGNDSKTVTLTHRRRK